MPGGRVLSLVRYSPVSSDDGSVMPLRLFLKVMRSSRAHGCLGSVPVLFLLVKSFLCGHGRFPVVSLPRVCNFFLVCLRLALCFLHVFLWWFLCPNAMALNERFRPGLLFAGGCG